MRFIVLLLLLIPSATAYIDPGTGGYIITAMWGWLVSIFGIAIAFLLKFYKHKVKKHLWWIFILFVVVLVSMQEKSNIPELPDFDPELVGVTLNTVGSYNGYTLVEGDLITNDGIIINSWPYWYLGSIDTNGDFYAQQHYESAIWGRYTWNGTKIWEIDMPIHHEILLEGDRIYVLTKEVQQYNERNVEFDVIVELDKNGTILSNWSTWDHLEEIQEHHRELELDKPPTSDVEENTWKNTSIWGGNYDYYHMNAISLVPNNTMQTLHPAFNPGNYIISFRHGSMVFIIDKVSGQILWKAIFDQVEGNLEGPHSPKMLPDGSILIYDNGRYRGWTRLIKLNPVNLDVLWEYKNDDFFSYSQGFVQPLPNGNILVTESEKGHVFEINSRNQKVWEWWHPEMINETDHKAYGKRDEIYRATRYSKEFIDQIRNETI